MKPSQLVWQSISESDRRLLEDCLQYTFENDHLPSMFKYIWERLDLTQKLLIEMMFDKAGHPLDSRGFLAL